MGVELSVDDFGTGFSSMDYLERVPVKEVKIDRSFVTTMGTDARDAAIAANGGVMPADPDALAAAGVHQEAGDFANSTAVAHPHLSFLGDVFAVPASWPGEQRLQRGRRHPRRGRAAGAALPVRLAAGAGALRRSARR